MRPFCCPEFYCGGEVVVGCCGVVVPPEFELLPYPDCPDEDCPKEDCPNEDCPNGLVLEEPVVEPGCPFSAGWFVKASAGWYGVVMIPPRSAVGS